MQSGQVMNNKPCQGSWWFWISYNWKNK